MLCMYVVYEWMLCRYGMRLDMCLRTLCISVVYVCMYDIGSVMYVCYVRMLCMPGTCV